MSMAFWIGLMPVMANVADDSCNCSEPLDNTGIIHEIQSADYRKNVVEAYAVEW